MATLAQKQNAPKKVFSFRWHGVNRKGQKVSGELQADSITTVKAELRKQGVNVTRVSKQGQGMFSKGGARIKPMDIAVISRQITTMLSAGVPLVQSLQIIARGHEKAAVRELIGQIAADVETGTPCRMRCAATPATSMPSTVIWWRRGSSQARWKPSTTGLPSIARRARRSNPK